MFWEDRKFPDRSALPPPAVVPVGCPPNQGVTFGGYCLGKGHVTHHVHVTGRAVFIDRTVLASTEAPHKHHDKLHKNTCHHTQNPGKGKQNRNIKKIK